MTKHSGDKTTASPTPDKSSTSSEGISKGTLGDGNSQIKQQGEVYQGKKTYFIRGTDIGREEQDSNKRLKNGKPVYPTTDLKNNTNGKDGEKNNKFQDGDYYLDGKKVILLNKSSEVDKDIILIYHPEFLYLMYTILADFASQDLSQKDNSNPYILPVKYTFGNIVHSEPTEQEYKDGTTIPTYYFSTMQGNSQSVGGRTRRSIGTPKTFDPTQTLKKSKFNFHFFKFLLPAEPAGRTN